MAECVYSLKMIRYTLTRFDPSLFLTISAGKQGTEYTPVALMILIVGCIVLFTVSYIQEKGVDIAGTIAKHSVILQVAIYFILFMAAMILGPMSAGRGFIYAQF